MEEKLKVLDQFFDHAAASENEGAYQEAVKAFKRSVVIIQDLVNNVVTSKTVKAKLMAKAVDSIKRTQTIENLLLHMEELKLKNDKQSVKTTENPKDVAKMLEEYFATPRGLKHTDEQKVALNNISHLVNITKPTKTLDDVIGMEGKTAIQTFSLGGFIFFSKSLHYLREV